jgi:hypothetical protein
LKYWTYTKNWEWHEPYRSEELVSKTGALLDESEFDTYILLYDIIENVGRNLTLKRWLKNMKAFDEALYSESIIMACYAGSWCYRAQVAPITRGLICNSFLLEHIGRQYAHDFQFARHELFDNCEISGMSAKLLYLVFSNTAMEPLLSEDLKIEEPWIELSAFRLLIKETYASVLVSDLRNSKKPNMVPPIKNRNPISGSSQDAKMQRRIPALDLHLANEKDEQEPTRKLA